MPVDGRKQNVQEQESLTRSSSQERILKKRGYTLGKILGEGSYAKVYLAEYFDPKSGKRHRLACKLINGTSAPKDFLRKFFPREVEIMSKVNHQYIIRVHSILQRKQKYFIFMQYGENGDLLEFIRNNGPVRERQARIWFAQVLKGLKYLHDREIAHRDMKCENLLLTAAYNIKISDFGFARYTTDDDGKKQVLSDTFCGSVSYASPEIIRGQPYDCKLADVWSIGIVLYIILNKAMPFDDSSLKKLYEAQMARNWKVRSKLKDVLTAEVKNYLHILLEPDPLKRKTLEELWQDPWIQRASNAELVAGGGLTAGKKVESPSLEKNPQPPASATKEAPEKSAVSSPAVRNEPADTLESQQAEFHEEVKAPEVVIAPETMTVSLEPSKADLKRMKSNVQIAAETKMPPENKLEFKRTRSQVNIARRMSSHGPEEPKPAAKTSQPNSAQSRTSRHSQSEQK